MENKEFYEVSREEYAAFVETLKPECRRIEVKENKDSTIYNIYSIKRDILLCARESNRHKPEKYYIYELANAEESRPPIAKTQLVLDSREQVQAFFNAVAKLAKEKK